MAEKGGTKILAIITICVMLVTVGFSGCIGDEGDDDDNLIIVISNRTNSLENITITVFNSNSIQIFNYTFLIKPDGYYTLKNITKEKGKYSLYYFVGANRTAIEDIKVGSYYSTVKLRIYDDHVEFFQEMN